MVPKLLIFFLLFNAALGSVSLLVGVDLCSPQNVGLVKDSSTGCLPTPTSFNDTNTNNLQANLTTPTFGSTNLLTTVVNGSITSGTYQNYQDPLGFGWLWNAAAILSGLPLMMINAFSGGFITNIILSVIGVNFAIPATAAMLNGIKAVLIVIFGIWIFYQFTGRFGSGGNV